MAYKTTTLNFFQFVPKNEKVYTSLDIQNCLLSLKGRDFFKMERSSKVVIIKDPLTVVGNYFVGAIYSVQMTNIPPALNTQNNEIRQLALELPEGLTKATCFLIDPQANILVIESGTGTSEAGLCRYLEFNDSKLPKMEPAIIINPGQIEHFYNMGSVYTFEAQLAKLEDGDLFNQKDNKAISQIIQVADDTNTDKLKVKLELFPDNKRQKGSLNKSKIASVVKGLLRYRESEEIESVRISGEVEGEGRIRTVELVKQRLHETIQYDIEERLIATFNLKDRQSLIAEKYELHRSGLLKSYKLAGTS